MSNWSCTDGVMNKAKDEKRKKEFFVGFHTLKILKGKINIIISSINLKNHFLKLNLIKKNHNLKIYEKICI